MTALPDTRKKVGMTFDKVLQQVIILEEVYQ